MIKKCCDEFFLVLEIYFINYDAYVMCSIFFVVKIGFITILKYYNEVHSKIFYAYNIFLHSNINFC